MNLQSFQLNGKNALVTGSHKGLGAAIAVGLGKAGANVGCHGRDPNPGPACEEILAAGRKTFYFSGDLADSRVPSDLIVKTIAEFGSIDILVNNAGVIRRAPAAEYPKEFWEELISVNLKSAFLVTQAVLPPMRQQKWGRIINMSSVAAQTGGVVGPHYAASKAGMLGITHSLANLLAREGITVNAIAPALIATDMVTSNLQANPGVIPLGRFGAVDEISSVAVMLAANGYITGQTINVNGGWYLS